MFQCLQKENCLIYGLKDECGACPHYEEIQNKFFEDE